MSKSTATSARTEQAGTRRGVVATPESAATQSSEAAIGPAPLRRTSCSCGGGCPDCQAQGKPLDPAIQQDMERAFGDDFSQVRVHTDDTAAASAASLDAAAYATGSSIVFGRNRYQPETMLGRYVIAHELAHVVQQRQASSPRVASIFAPRPTPSADSVHEADADMAAAGVLDGARVRVPHRGAAPRVQPFGESLWSAWQYVSSLGSRFRYVGQAISQSGPFLGAAIRHRLGEGARDLLLGALFAIVAAAAILGVTTGAGAAIGALAGAGVGAAPGAAAGYELGLAIIHWLGLGALILYVGSQIVSVGGAFLRFLSTAWGSNGDANVIQRAAREFADAIARLMSAIMQALVMLLVSWGTGRMIGFLRGTRFGTLVNETRLMQWLAERHAMRAAGESPLTTARDVNPAAGTGPRPEAGTIVVRGPTEASVRRAYLRQMFRDEAAEIESAIIRRQLPGGGEEYAVVQGRRGGVSVPEGWESTAHTHPGAGLETGFRNPAPQDYGVGLPPSTFTRAVTSGRSQIERVTWRDVAGRVFETEFGVDPADPSTPLLVRPPGVRQWQRFRDVYPDSIEPQLNLAQTLQQRLAILRTLSDDYYAGWWARNFGGNVPDPPAVPPTLVALLRAILATPAARAAANAVENQRSSGSQ